MKILASRFAQATHQLPPPSQSSSCVALPSSRSIGHRTSSPLIRQFLSSPCSAQFNCYDWCHIHAIGTKLHVLRPPCSDSLPCACLMAVSQVNPHLLRTVGSWNCFAEVLGWGLFVEIIIVAVIGSCVMESVYDSGLVDERPQLSRPLVVRSDCYSSWQQLDFHDSPAVVFVIGHGSVWRRGNLTQCLRGWTGMRRVWCWTSGMKSIGLNRPGIMSSAEEETAGNSLTSLSRSWEYLYFSRPGSHGADTLNCRPPADESRPILQTGPSSPAADIIPCFPRIPISAAVTHLLAALRPTLTNPLPACPGHGVFSSSMKANRC